MKKMKHLLTIALLSAIVIAGSTCKNNIGLGAAVDITPPTASISQPKMKATVRNSFTMRGTAKDDSYIKTVTVTFNNKEFNKHYGPYAAEVDNEKHTWKLVANRKTGGKFPMMDGVYDVKVVVIDGSDKNVEVSSILTIDNTPPLLILNRPGTLASDNSVDTLGDTIWIEGQAADTSEIKWLNFNVYDKSTKKLITSKKEGNVPPNVKLNMGSFSKQSKLYLDLYGEEQKAGKKEYYFNIEICDGAEECESPDSDGKASEGNIANVYYLYDPLYNLAFPEYTATEIYSMMNGRYYINPATGEELENEETAKAKKLLENLLAGKFPSSLNSFKVVKENGDSISNEITTGSFALNPVIEPRYEIIGFMPTATLNSGGTIIGEPNNIPDFTAGNSINLRLSPNLDNVPIALSEGKPACKYYLIKYEKYKTLGSNFDINKITDGEVAAIDKIELEVTNSNKQGSSFIVTLDTPENKPTELGEVYVLLVRGQDVDEHGFIADDKGKITQEASGFQYLFKVVGAGKAPALSIKKFETEDASGENNGSNIIKQVYIGKGKDISFTVTVNSEEWPVVLKYSLKKDSVSIVGEITDTIGVKGSKKKEETKKITISKAGIPQTESGVYTLLVDAISVNEQKSDRTYTIYYDTDAPDITVEGFELNSVEIKKTEVFPTLKGSVSDGSGVGIDFSDVNSFTANYKYNDGAETPLNFSKKGNGWVLSPPSEKPEGKYEVILRAKDKFGLTSEGNILFSYDAAPPKIISVNGILTENIEKGSEQFFNSLTFTVEGEIEETNGLKKENVSIKIDDNPAGAVDSLTVVSAGKYRFEKQVTCSHNNDGKRLLTVEAKDESGNISSLKNIKVIIDTKDPEFKSIKFGEAGEITNFEPKTPIDSVTVNSSTVAVIGLFSDEGSGIDKVVVRYRYNSNDEEINIPAKYDEGKSGYTINHPLSFDLGDTEPVIFKIYDKTGKSKEWKLKVTVENGTLALKLAVDCAGKIEKDGTIHVNKDFTVQCMGTYLQASPLTDLNLQVTKDTQTFDMTNFYKSAKHFQGGALSTLGEVTPAPVFTPELGDEIGGVKNKNKFSGIHTGTKIRVDRYDFLFKGATDKPSHDGRYVFKFGRGSDNTTLAVFVDTKGPSITPIEPQEESVINNARPHFKISLFDDTGIEAGSIKANYKRVSPSAGSLETVVLSDSDKDGQPSSDLAEGKYSIYFTASDKLGNVGQSATRYFFIDTAAPVISNVLINDKSDNVVIVKNAQKVVIKGKVKDSNNMGSVGMTVKRAGNMVKEEVKPISGNTLTDFSFEIPTSFLSVVDTYTVELKAEDEAGRSSQSFVSFRIDNELPEIKDITPGGIVNKNIVLKGGTSDNIGLESVTVSDDKGKVNRTFNGNDAFNWNIPIDTTQYPDGAVQFTITAKDLAGHTKVGTHSITVNQDTDRPIISITNLIGAVSSNSSARSKFTEKNISGKIEDDDGIIKKLEIADNDSFSGKMEFTDVDKWSYTLSEGEKTLYFRVTDRNDGVFVNKSGASIGQPKIKSQADESVVIGEKLELLVDRTAPEFARKKMMSNASDFSGLKDLEIPLNCGNNKYATLYLEVYAKDSNGIQSLKAELPGGIEKAAVKQSGSETIGGDTYEIWRFEEGIPVSSLPEGVQNITLKLTDNCGLVTSEPLTLIVDNTAPTVALTAPEANSGTSAEIEIRTQLAGRADIQGIFDSGSGSGIDPETIKCEIGQTSKISLDKDSTTNMSTGKKIELSRTSATWALKFDDISELVKDSVAQAKYGTGRKFDVDGNVNPSGKVIEVPIKVFIEDKAGNKKSVTYKIRINSDGKTPELTLLSPNKQVSGTGGYNGYSIETLGGNIMFSGLAGTKIAGLGKVTEIEARFSESEDFSASFVDSLGNEWKNGRKVAEDIANGFSSWDFLIDGSVFLKSATQRTLYYSVRGKNSEGTYGAWIETKKIMLDVNAPRFDKMYIGSPSNLYKDRMGIKSGDILMLELLSTQGVGEVKIETATKGADSIKKKITDFSSYTALSGAGTTGYKIPIDLDVDALNDPEENLVITVTVTNEIGSPKLVNFKQFMFKYDKYKPQLVFGTPVGKFDNNAVFYADNAIGVDGVTAGLSVETLYLYVKDDNGQAQEIKVTGIDPSHKKVMYASKPANVSSQPVYVLFQKDLAVFNGNSNYQLKGIANDRGTGVKEVSVTIDSKTITMVRGAARDKVTAELDTFATFVGDFDVSLCATGRQNMSLQAFDMAGNDSGIINQTVYIRNEPILIKSVEVKSDLNKSGTYETSSGGALIESIVIKPIKPGSGMSPGTELPIPADVNKGNRYFHTADTVGSFVIKNASKSEIAVSLVGGTGSGRSYKLFKRDGTNEYLIDSGTWSGAVGGTINLQSKFGTGNNKIPEGQSTLILRVFDTASVNDTERFAEMIVKIFVKTNDDSEPQVAILPFYWNSDKNNSLKDNSSANGHIEIAKVSSGAGKSDVSGSVVVRGFAYHPALLDGLSIKIGSASSISVSYTSGTWSTSSGLTVKDERVGFNGHWVSWAYVWNTGTPEANIAVVVTASSGSKTSSTNAVGSEPTKNTAEERSSKTSLKLKSTDSASVGQFIRLVKDEQSHLVTITSVDGKVIKWEGDIDTDIEQYHLYPIDYDSAKKPTFNSPSFNVNVVPYVTALKRDKKYNTHRSSSGAYSLLRERTSPQTGDNDTVTVEGFNLTGTVKIKVPGVSGEITLSSGTFTLPDNAKSGKVEITAGTIKATNNLNNNSKAYNKQNIDSKPETAYWTDDLAINVWKDDDSFAGSTNAKFPSMAMGSTGDLFAAFSNYSEAKVYYSKLGESSARPYVFWGYDPPEEASISVADTGTVNVLYSANYHGGQAYNWNTGSSTDAGGLFCYDVSADEIATHASYKNAPPNYLLISKAGRIHKFELFYHNKQLQQFKNFRVTRGNNNRIHIAYYDTLTNAVKYATVMNNATTSEYWENEWVNLDGGYDDDDWKNLNRSSDRYAYNYSGYVKSPSMTTFKSSILGVNTSGATPVINNNGFEDGLSRIGSTAEYCAIALDGSNRPVVVYADVDEGILRLARANDAAPTATSNWAVQKVLPDNDPNAGLVSDYFTAKFDSAGCLHIAFRNTRGQLCYVKSTNANAGTSAYTFGQSVVIDEAGSWADITLDGTVPYISYMSKVNAFDGIKIAYYDADLVKTWNDNGSENEKGAWNTMTAAMRNRSNNVRTCIAVAPNTTLGWKAAVGYTPGNIYNVVKYIDK